MAKPIPPRSLAPKPRRKDLPPRPFAAPAPGPAAATAWERPAAWYDQHVGDDGDDFYRRLILPTVLQRLAAKPGQTVLDVACGQGVLGRALGSSGVKTLGVDAAPALIDAARRRAGHLESHLVGDVRNLGQVLGDTRTDHAALVMCLQDLDPIAPVLAGTAAAVRPGGHVVAVMTHPCFRIPRRSTWGWDEDNGVQYRRLDGYLSPLTVPIKLHPGQPADPTRTLSFHRPLSTYIAAFAAAGLGVIGADELCSHRRGTIGARSGAEDRAAKEFPVFLVLTGIRLPTSF